MSVLYYSPSTTYLLHFNPSYRQATQLSSTEILLREMDMTSLVERGASSQELGHEKRDGKVPYL